MFYFFFISYGDHRDLHSFPTRRSSDLSDRKAWRSNDVLAPVRREPDPAIAVEAVLRSNPSAGKWAQPPPEQPSHTRSEEHTSELQSHSDLVCRLLLEKKKKKNKEKNTI